MNLNQPRLRFSLGRQGIASWFDTLERDLEAPLDARRLGSGWFSGFFALLLAVVGFCLVHAAAFLALKTDGEVRVRAGRFARWMPALLVPLALWVVAVQLMNGKAYTWLLVAGAVAAAVWAFLSARRGREGTAFAGMAGFLLLGVASIFANVYPAVLPSTIDSAFDLTVSNASSSSYTLGVMSVVAAFGIPVVLAAAWIVGVLDALHHARDAWAIMPVAPVLSLVAAVLACIATWMRFSKLRGVPASRTRGAA